MVFGGQMTIEIANSDALDPESCTAIVDTLEKLVLAPNLFPPQRTLLPTRTFFDDIEVTVAIVDDATIQELNRTWRSKDKATDVLSWPAVNIDDPLEPFLGDIAISLDTAKQQAAKRAWSLTDEICLLAVHGFLHLLGHDDDEDDDAARMRSLERFAVGKPLTLDGDDNAEA